MKDVVRSIETVTTEIKMLEKSMKKSMIEHGWEIGERLVYVKENLNYGNFGEWLEEKFEFSWKYATQFMKFYKLNPDLKLTSNLPSWTHAVEMLSLPESVDRSEFIEKEHIVPSTGESKAVNEMTVKELREVKAALRNSEKTIATLSEKLEQEMNKPTQFITQTIETIPDDYADLKQQAINGQRLSNENVRLQRKNQELIHQVSENKSTSTSLRKLKEYCIESIRTISASNAALLYELSVLEGNAEAHKIADEYGNKLSEITSEFFKELKEAMEAKKIF